MPEARGNFVFINSFNSEMVFDPVFGLTKYCKFGRLKLHKNHLQFEFKLSCCKISARTRVVAVAVNAIIGTFGKRFRSTPNLV